MDEQLVFGSPEANRIAAEIKFLERRALPELRRVCGVGPVLRFSSFDDAADGVPLPAGVYYRLGCPRCRIQGQWKRTRKMPCSVGQVYRDLVGSERRTTESGW